jgi:cobalt-zinc-cadmium efflux system outer membrane protein
MLIRGVSRLGVVALALLFGTSWHLVGAAEATEARTADPLTREQAVAEALAANPTLKAFEREVQAARARQLQADGFAPPTVFWDFDEAQPITSPGRFGSQVVGVEQRFEWFGVRRARKEAAALGVQAAQALLDRARARVIARTRKTFDDALRAQEVVALLGRASRLAAEAVEIARARFRSGASSYVDFLRLRVRREQLQNERRQAQVRAAAARRELNALLARAGEPLVLRGELAPPAAALPPGIEDLAETRAVAPTLRFLEFQVAEARKRYDIARKERYPEITLGAGRQRLIAGGASDYAWSGQIGLRFPLPGSDRQQGIEGEALAQMYARVDRARAQRLIVQARLRQRLDEAIAAAQRVEDFRKVLLPDTEDQLQAAQQDYRVRRIGALALVDVFNTYVEVRRDYLEALVELRAATTDLETFGEDLWEVEL